MTRLTRDYSELAGDYDEARFHGDKGIVLYNADATIVRELVQSASPSTVLDVGCGTGRVAHYLEDTSIQYAGCDFTRAMLRRACDRMETSPRTFLQADASRLPIATEVVDCIVSLRFLHLFAFRERRVFVSEFARVLRPGGYAVCSFTNGWYAGGMNWIGKLRGRRHEVFLAPGELRRLFPGWKVCALRGNFVPLQWYVSKTCPPLGRTLRWLNRRPPLNYLCWERFYLLQKPQT